MPSAFRTPKNLAEWLRLDYFRYPRRLPRLRRALCWAALLLCVGVLGAAALSRRDPTLYQAGPLSPGHAKFNDNCGACHQNSFATATRFLPWKQDVSSVPDSACQNCHNNPPHSEQLLTTEHCASCHQEHRGHASLAQLPDARCLSCHRDLPAHSKHGATEKVMNVSGFPEGHGEFHGLGKDPGQIEFNHSKHVHLSVPPLKPLDCAACHQPDAAGKYMKPITYEANCKSCHPLSVQLGGEFAAELQPAVKAFAAEPAPHTAPNIVRAVLRDRLLKFVEAQPLRVLDVAAEGARTMPRPKPSLDSDLQKTRWGLAAADKMTEGDKFGFVKRQLALAEQLCFDRGGGCALCHVETQPRPLGRGLLPVYAKSDIPERWFLKSHFDHRAHRLRNCTDCHPLADQSVQSSDVMMPGLQTCAQCHNARAARTDCLECHTYHPRDHGLEVPRQRPSVLSLGK